jgi:hypothetical protein
VALRHGVKTIVGPRQTKYDCQLSLHLRVRRFFSLVVPVILSVALGLVIAIWGGPLTSGAFLLTRGTGKRPVSHDEDLSLSRTPPFYSRLAFVLV